MCYLPTIRINLGIFLISFTVLFFELMLTRLFSVTLHYHLSFMAISLAMLGFGASGLIVNLWPSYFRQSGLGVQLAWGAISFAAASVFVVGMAFYLSVSMHPSPGNLLRLGLIYGLCVIPFLVGGLVVALILTHYAEQANRLYFFDLLGAALGCLAFVPATNYFGAPTAVLVGAAVAAAAAVVLAEKNGSRLRRLALMLSGCLVIAAVANGQWNFYDVRVTKGERQPPMLALKWNAFSRVDVLGTPEDLSIPRVPLSFGFSTSLDPEFRIPEVHLRYDADALTQITHFDGDVSRLQHLRYDIASAPYQIRQYRNVLIIGPGGGRDILTALYMGSGPITGVEVNPLTIQLMQQQFRAFTGGLYDDYPGVRVINDEGRSFLQHTPSQYDLIQASLIDTWAASAAGVHALTENSLYTVEAFSDYLRHLTPDGVISFSRWYHHPPVEALRVITLAIEALRQQGVSDTASHVFVVRTNEAETQKPSMCTILLKRSPFTTTELAKLRVWSLQMGFLISYSPDDPTLSVTPNEFHQLLSQQSAQFIANFPYDISAVYDDRPFFFNRVPVLPWIAHRLGLASSRVGEGTLTLGGQTLLILLVVTAACTLLLLFLPLTAARWVPDERSAPMVANVRRPRAMVWALYFASLGLGFIMVEVVLIQRFTLFLGYPVYSLSVVLFTMLLASSIGSLLADRWSQPQILMRVIGLLCVTLALYALMLPWILKTTLGATTAVRILIAAVLITPLGLLMGMPFPTGLKRAAREAKGLVSWAWAVNGGASVFGSVLAILISMTYGFTSTFLIGAGIYAVALCGFVKLTYSDAITEQVDAWRHVN